MPKILLMRFGKEVQERGSLETVLGQETLVSYKQAIFRKEKREDSKAL